MIKQAINSANVLGSPRVTESTDAAVKGMIALIWGRIKVLEALKNPSAHVRDILIEELWFVVGVTVFANRERVIATLH